MKVGIVILNYNTKDLLRVCLESVFKYFPNNAQIYVVDNNSSDGSVNMLKNDFPKIHLIENEANLGFSAGNNRALREIKADYYLLLNSDTKVVDDAIEKLVKFADQNNLGIASCKLINPDLTVQPNFGDLPFGLPLFVWLFGIDDLVSQFLSLPSFHQNITSDSEQKVGWVSGAAMLIKHKVLDKVGPLDEKIFMYSEDVEFCTRAKRAGFKIGWTSQTSIIHLGGGSSKNPSLTQRLGEFRGLLYIYKKFYNTLVAFLIKILIYLAILL